MLHSVNYHYACYLYALLCLLHQQQQAAAITIQIDGATQSEWNTGDEYRKLVGSLAAPGGADSAAQLGASLGGAASAGGRRRAGQQPQEKSAAPLGLDQLLAGAAAAVAQARQRPISPPSPPSSSSLHPASISSSSTSSRASTLTREGAGVEGEGEPTAEAEAAEAMLEQEEKLLEGLDLIQKELQHRRRQQQIADAIERLEESDSANGLAAAGARTIADLTPTGDFNDYHSRTPVRTLIEREVAARKYCGGILVEMVAIVCDHQYYGGTPDVVQPTIKTRRMVSAEGEQVSVGRRRNLLSSNAAGARRSRRDMGLTEECCARACTIDQMRQYCAKPKQR